MPLDLAEKLLGSLGYDKSPGYASASDFAHLKRHRFHLLQACERMGVVGAFGLGNPAQSNFAPVVLIATASSQTEAQNIHRLAWSQGLAPFVCIATGGGVYVCEAFAYRSHNWGRDNFVPEDLLDRTGQKAPPSLLSQLSAKRLRTSLAWRDGLMSIENRIDEAMLANLKLAGDILVNDQRGLVPLTAGQANALIGRILYLNFIISRDIVEPSWLKSVGIDVDSRARWEPHWLWTVFDKLDALLNGSIFPLQSEDRESISADHIDIVRGVIGYADRIQALADDRGLFPVDLSVIRTETLSAIYEQFLLRGDDPQACDGSLTTSTDAAFYTPPFLVDYMLTELEEYTPIVRGKQILDGAAGSGVFLVACYRRLIEHLLPAQQRYLPHEVLLGLMRDSIFAIERHPDACHVAAFSLYLTMLEYTDPEEVHSLTSEVVYDSGRKLFPPMVAPAGNNILQRDLFEPKRLPAGFPRRFHIVVGNPPWGQVEGLRDPHHIKRFFGRIQTTHPVGDEQAAELFFWRLTRWYLTPEGTASLLMPLKSFVNARSKAFVAAVGKKMAIVSLANLSHLRRRLFRRAIHPAVVVTVSRLQAARGEGTRIHSPNLASQPIGRDRWLWTLTADSSAVEIIEDQPTINPDRFLHDAFVRHPVDRRIASFLSDRIQNGSLLSLRQLDAYGLIWKSGDQQRRTGIPSNMHLSSNRRAATYLENHLIRRNGHWVARPPGSRAPPDPNEMPDTIVPLDEGWLHKARGEFPQFFGGRVVAVPRSLERAYFVVPAAAFNSSFNLFALRADHRRTGKGLLEALTLYLESLPFRYFAALNSRQMMIDRWVIELESMLDLPFPFAGPDDGSLAAYLEGDSEERDRLLRRCLKLPDEYWRIIGEFFEERRPLANGNVPARALRVPEGADIKAYLAVFESRVRSLFGSTRMLAKVRDVDDGLLVIQLRPEWSSDNPHLVQRALTEYQRSAVDVFSCSTYVHHDRDSDQLFIVKPAQRFYWTRDRAYSDANLLDAALVG